MASTTSANSTAQYEEQMIHNNEQNKQHPLYTARPNLTRQNIDNQGRFIKIQAPIQLHLSPVFSQKNTVKSIRPGTILRVEQLMTK